MKVLIDETKDKKNRKILDITEEQVIELLKEDYGLHEVIDMIDPISKVRLYFDIETYNLDETEVLKECFTKLNKFFNCNNDNWAVSSCNRRIKDEYKISYHFLSKKYSLTLTHLRNIANKLKKTLPYIDTSAYWFNMAYNKDEGSLRLPNQSKKIINKEGEPMKIIQGDIKDFFVTVTTNL